MKKGGACRSFLRPTRAFKNLSFISAYCHIMVPVVKRIVADVKTRGRLKGKDRKMIVVEELTKKYGNCVAVDHLSFQVEKGMIYGFLGPNGAGKSTTMNAITGYLAPTSGRILIDGKDVQKEPEEAKKKVGYLPEIPPLYVDETVEEFLYFAAGLKKIPAKQRKEQVEKVMEMVGVTDVRGRLIKNISKGYKQRVGLAQAILGDPEVLILDEPSVGLDPKQIIEMRELIKKLGKEHTIILSSHVLSEVSAVCDHVMIIARGKLIASDTPEGLKKMLEGKMEILLTVKGDEQNARDVLKKLDGIDEVENAETKEKDCVRFKITCKEGVDVREALFFAFAKAQMPIMEMSHEEKSLEDVFLELTEDASQEEKDASEGKVGTDADPGEENENEAESKTVGEEK